MNAWIAALLLVIAALVPAGVVFSFSHSGQTYTVVGTGGNANSVPGPLVGASLPVLVLAGGAYWAVRRARRKTDKRSVRSGSE